MFTNSYAGGFGDINRGINLRSEFLDYKWRALLSEIEMTYRDSNSGLLDGSLSPAPTVNVSMCDWRNSFSDGTKMWALPIPWPVKPSHAAEFYSAQFQQRSNNARIDRMGSDNPQTVNAEVMVSGDGITPVQVVPTGLADYVTSELESAAFLFASLGGPFSIRPVDPSMAMDGKGARELKGRGALYFHDYMVRCSRCSRNRCWERPCALLPATSARAAVPPAALLLRSSWPTHEEFELAGSVAR